MTLTASDEDRRADGQVGDLERCWIVRRVIRAKAGDRAAFDDLYERYSRLVHGILLARLPPREVPDQLQEVFMLAFRKLPALREPASFLPWLSTLARRTAASQYRTMQRWIEYDSDLLAKAAVEPRLTTEGLAILQAMATLPNAYRETLVLRLVEGLSGREISEFTGLTEGSVRVNLSRGMAMLRARLEVDDDD